MADSESGWDFEGFEPFKDGENSQTSELIQTWI